MTNIEKIAELAEVTVEQARAVLCALELVAKDDGINLTEAVMRNGSDEAQGTLPFLGSEYTPL